MSSPASSERTTRTLIKCWGFGKPFGLNVYLRAFWLGGPHIRWQFMWWIPGGNVRWGNADRDFEPLTPEDEIELMSWGVHMGGHDDA